MKRCPSCKRKLGDALQFCPFDGFALISDEDELIGTTLDGKYRLEQVLGKGTRGVTYKATNLFLDRPVAIKILDAGFHSNRTALSQLRQAAWIRHSSIVALLDFGTAKDTGSIYLVMEFLEGVELKEKIYKHNRLGLEETLLITKQTCTALQAAHQGGIIHRDIKPDNIWLMKTRTAFERVVVSGFGLARLETDPDINWITGDLIIEGEPHYMSPEQCRGEVLDARSDIYSMGVVLYEMLTGQVPFLATTLTGVALKHVNEAPRPPREFRPDISREVEAVVLRALSKNKKDRQQSAFQLAQELEDAIHEARYSPVLAESSRSGGSDYIGGDFIGAGSKAVIERKLNYLDENVQFTVYRPGTIRPQKWYTMLAFAHLSERPPDAPEDEPDPLEEVQRQARQVLGEQAADYQDIRQESRLAVPREGELTFVPEVTGLEFNPRYRSFIWQETVHREDFRLRASASVDGKTVRGRLSVFLGSILLAEVRLSIKVDASSAAARKSTPQEIAHARAFRKIFASYSHKDASIVEEFERIARASGDEYIRDWTHLRSGEVWSDRLVQMIQEATVFQLFWSRNSMYSRFVRQEWEYALSLGRPGFIRPLYWEEPFPESEEDALPPEDLRRLQFHRLITGGGARAHTPDQPALPNEMASIRPSGDYRIPTLTTAPMQSQTSQASERIETKRGNPVGRYKMLGTAMIAIIILFGGVSMYTLYTLSGRKTNVKAPVNSNNAAANAVSPAEIAEAYSGAVVHINADWRLIHAPTDRQVYHLYVPNSYKDKPIIDDGRKYVAAYILASGGVVEPYLTTDSTSGRPIRGLRAGSGFAVTRDGFILTSRDLAAGWDAGYVFPQDAAQGVVLKAAGVVTTSEENPVIVQAPENWVASKTFKGVQSMGEGVELRDDTLAVTFPETGLQILAHLVRVSNRQNVAVIKIDLPDAIKSVELYDNFDLAKPGDRISILSYPKASSQFGPAPAPTVSVGNIGAIISARSAPGNNVDSDVSSSNGAPVFDDRGRVIGVFSAGRTSQGAPYNFAVPIRYAQEIMPGGSSGGWTSENDAVFLLSTDKR